MLAKTADKYINASRKYWQISVAVLVICMPAASLSQTPSDEESLTFFTRATESVITGFKVVFCTPLAPDQRNLCRATPISVVRSWGIGAFASRNGDQPLISISAGTTAVLDNLTWARSASAEIAGDDDCFLAFANSYSSIIGYNQAQTQAGRPLRRMISIVDFAMQKPDICPRINFNSYASHIRNNSATHAKEVESGLSFILLHELGHVVLRHINMNVSDINSRRRMELEADTWAIKAATQAKQHLLDVSPLWLTLLQGASLDWEQHSDHPLGVRRAKNFFQLLKSEYDANESFRHPLVLSGIYDEVVDALEKNIEIANTCLRRIERGETISRC